MTTSFAAAHLLLVLALAGADAQNIVAAQSRQEVQVVPSVDLDRYAGRWYEIARYPNRFQRDCTGDVRATYTRRPDGRIDVLNQCATADGVNDARGIARVADKTTNAKLEVRFAPAILSWIPAVWGDYWVIGLDPDYRWAVVGSPDRKYLWVLSRTPLMADADYAAAVSGAASNGFDPGGLVKTPQQE